MEAIETLAGQWIEEHPEHHADFADAEAALEKMYEVEVARPIRFCTCPCICPLASSAR